MVDAVAQFSESFYLTYLKLLFHYQRIELLRLLAAQTKTPRNRLALCSLKRTLQLRMGERLNRYGLRGASA